MHIPLGILQLVVASGTLFAFQQFPLISWMGRIVSVERQTIHATSGPQGTLTNLTITLASGGKVWKKTTRNDFSVIRVGDEIWVRGYRTAVGELAATEIYANITRFEGIITNVTANGYEVEVHNVEGIPVGRKIVTVDAGTVTGRDVPLSMKGYFEPDDEWYIRPEPYWSLFEKNKDAPWAEEIATTVALRVIPSDECYSECALSKIVQGPLQYWTRYPNGKSIHEALQKAISHATYAVETSIYNAPPQPTLNEIRRSLANVTVPEKRRLLDLLDEADRKYSERR